MCHRIPHARCRRVPEVTFSWKNLSSHWQLNPNLPGNKSMLSTWTIVVGHGGGDSTQKLSSHFLYLSASVKGYLYVCSTLFHPLPPSDEKRILPIVSYLVKYPVPRSDGYEHSKHSEICGVRKSPGKSLGMYPSLVENIYRLVYFPLGNGRYSLQTGWIYLCQPHPWKILAC